MPTFQDLSERVERLLVRHDELKRTNDLLTRQLEAVMAERDAFKARLSTARARVDALLERVPRDLDGRVSDGSAA